MQNLAKKEEKNKTSFEPSDQTRKFSFFLLPVTLTTNPGCISAHTTLPPPPPVLLQSLGREGPRVTKGQIGVRPEMGKISSLDTSNLSDFFFFFFKKPASALYFTVSVRIRF